MFQIAGGIIIAFLVISHAAALAHLATGLFVVVLILAVVIGAVIMLRAAGGVFCAVVAAPFYWFAQRYSGIARWAQTIGLVIFGCLFGLVWAGPCIFACVSIASDPHRPLFSKIALVTFWFVFGVTPFVYCYWADRKAKGGAPAVGVPGGPTQGDPASAPTSAP